MADPLITGKKITEAEYFELDEGSEEPLTFYDGEVFDALHFPDLNCDLPLRAIYRRIHFPE